MKISLGWLVGMSVIYIYDGDMHSLKIELAQKFVSRTLMYPQKSLQNFCINFSVQFCIAKNS